MSTEFTRGIAAQAWCTPETSDIEMDVRLAEAFADILDKYIEALQWCSGSADFNVGGQARKGWLKICVPLIRDDEKQAAE